MPLLELAPQISEAADVLIAGWPCSHGASRSGAGSRVRNEHVARAVIAFATRRQQEGALVAVVEYRDSRDLPAIINVISFVKVEP